MRPGIAVFVTLSMVFAAGSAAAGTDGDSGMVLGRLDAPAAVPSVKLLAAIRTLYRTAAEWQYNAIGRTDGCLYYSGPKGLYAVRDIYSSLLTMAGALESANGTRDRGIDRLLSRVYSEAAWFSFRTGAPGNRIGEPSGPLLRRALDLDAKNAEAWYEHAEITREQWLAEHSDVRRTAETERVKAERAEVERSIEADCETAVTIDPRFPEAWSELMLHYARTRELGKASYARGRWLETLADFKPQLHFFDTGYPQVNETYLLGRGKILERKIYRTDPGRFLIDEKWEGSR